MVDCSHGRLVDFRLTWLDAAGMIERLADWLAWLLAWLIGWSVGWSTVLGGCWHGCLVSWFVSMVGWMRLTRLVIFAGMVDWFYGCYVSMDGWLAEARESGRRRSRHFF